MINEGGTAVLSGAHEFYLVLVGFELLQLQFSV
jgi:hypothetical protein